MDHSQLKATAAAVLGFVPGWSPRTCTAICERMEELGTIPAVYLRAVVEHMNLHGSKLRFANVILSRKWEEFIPAQLQLLKEQATVRRDSDLIEFRSALQVCDGDYREVLEDEHFNISALGRYRISKMYGLEEVAEKYERAATRDTLSNPFLAEAYDKLEDAK